MAERDKLQSLYEHVHHLLRNGCQHRWRVSLEASPVRPLQDIKMFWKAVTAEAGIREYRLHDNRHTHASHLVSSGLSLEIVGRLLGHANPTTTKRYAHIADTPLRPAAERFGAKLDALHRGQKGEIIRPK